MTVRDYNGEGVWSAANILARYRELSVRFGIEPRDLVARTSTQGGTTWVWPVMEGIIAGIEAGDIACAQIGIEFIEEDRGFPFGAILKSNTARALRRFDGLTAVQIERIRGRIARMYASGIVPREFGQYLKLLRRVGAGGHWPVFLAAEPRNRFAHRARAFLSRWFDAEGRPKPERLGP